MKPDIPRPGAHGRRRRIIAVALLLLVVGLLGWGLQQGTFKQVRAYRDGLRAYVYGLPLMLMAATSHTMAGEAGRDEGLCGMNEFMHARRFLNARFREVVRPNVDTLYSSAWLDLAREPMVLHLPDMQGRYHLLPMLDAWTNVFAAPGSRTTGDKAGDYAIVGPGFFGALPPGLTRIDAPTNKVWIIGRLLASGSEDYPAVHALQDAMRLTPLSRWRAGAGAQVDDAEASCTQRSRAGEAAPLEQVLALDAQTYFSRLAQLMQDNPAPARDAPILAALREIGIVPGQPFDLTALDPRVAAGIVQAAHAGQALASTVANARSEPDRQGGPGLFRTLPKLAMKTLAESKQGWTYPRKLGEYGTNYVFRSLIAILGLGANLDVDALYPNTEVDATGERLNGSGRYVLHFDKQSLPPVAAFWSLTLYGSDHYFVDNPIDRYALGSLTRGLRYNEDGSLDILIQEDPPIGRESNWLPAPAGNFSLNLRLYRPGPQALDGSWRAPAVQRLPAGAEPDRRNVSK